MPFKGKTSILIIIAIVILFLFNTTAFTGVYATEQKYNMSYIYFGSSTKYTESVDQTKNSLNEISPNYFNLDKDGNLILTPAVSKNFVDEMHSRGIQVVPFISNHWDRAIGQAALINREKLATDIANAIKDYNLNGINVDLENLTDKERDQYTDFVRLLREKLSSEKIVSVSVAANPYGSTTGWKGSYDYAGLGNYCDYLMIMTYDEHYHNGEPGPVASLQFAEKSVQYALTQVSKNKIVLGVTFYGRIWKNGSDIFQGNGVSNFQIGELIKKYDGSIVFDKASSTPYATITINASDVKPKIHGNALPEGTYTIWFENEQSIKRKLDIVQKYDIKGTGSWSLGEEDKNTWDYYKLWLNGCYFNDVDDHWARDAILTAYEKDWIKGITDTSFCPDTPLTRAQAASIMVRMLGIVNSINEDGSFLDTKGHWAEADIETARRYNIINGTGNNLFEPDTPITREQMAVMMNNILKSEVSFADHKTMQFPDVNSIDNNWSYQAISEMKQYGIISGFLDGSFRPTQLLTRAQMTTMINSLSVYID